MERVYAYIIEVRVDRWIRFVKKLYEDKEERNERYIKNLYKVAEVDKGDCIIKNAIVEVE